ncbi:MAG: hypothetical protein VX278_09390, partial [Myxococcota bacterium]|nr:hypothetical protein [Myxococcota bacterium]
RLRWSEKRVYQQDVVRRWQRFRKSTPLKEACLERPKTELLTFSFLGTRCAKETLRDNLWVVFPRHTPFGVVWTLLGLFSLLLPWGKRQWDSVVFVVGLTVPASIWLSWTHFPDRYMLLYAGPLTAMGPLSIFRLIEAVGKTETLATKIQTGGFLGALFLVYTWEMDYCNRFATTALQQNQKEAQKRELVRVLSMHRSPEEPFVDCTDSGVEAAFLPALYHTREERRTRCSQISKKADSGWFWIESRTIEIEDDQNWEKFWASDRQELWLKR